MTLSALRKDPEMDRTQGIIIVIHGGCAHQNLSVARVYAEQGELPMDVYHRVCEAVGDCAELPHYAGSFGYAPALI